MRVLAFIFRMRTLLTSCVAVSVLALTPLGACAHQLLRGTVLAVEAGNGTAIVHYAAFAGGPSLTKAFRVDPASALRTLHVGERITGEVETQTLPWTLHDPAPAASAAVPALDQVAPVQLDSRIPDPPLADQSGRAFRLSSLRGQDVVIGFIYTRCRDKNECPLTSEKFAELQSLVHAHAATHLVLVTLDPAYDTVPVLAAYAQRYGADSSRWSFLTGDVRTVIDFIKGFGVNPLADPQEGMIHEEVTAIVDRSGIVRNVITTNSWQPGEIVAELNAIDGKFANPLVRLDLALSREAVAVCGNSVAGFDGFVDLGVVSLIFLAFFWGMYRLYRAINHAPEGR